MSLEVVCVLFGSDSESLFGLLEMVLSVDVSRLQSTVFGGFHERRIDDELKQTVITRIH